jgi:hypothetical protein
LQRHAGRYRELIVARGFESKDVEFQQAEAERTKKLGWPLTAEERDRKNRRQSIELALARARGDLAIARTAAHRKMLSDAIATLEHELQVLS